jgi:hypothetical protein
VSPGTKVTTKKLGEILPKVMAKLQANVSSQPKAIIDAWPAIIGPELAPMTRALRFENGVLYVNVKNSTLLSLLSNQKDKQKLLDQYKMKLTGIQIRNIMFRIG